MLKNITVSVPLSGLLFLNLKTSGVQIRYECFRPLIGVIISKRYSYLGASIFLKSFRPLIGVIISKPNRRLYAD